MLEKNKIIAERNKKWERNSYIPKWVDLDNVDLDQFFTKPEIAKKCHDNFIKLLQKDGIDLSQYAFIEPSAGNGAFFNLLNKRNRIGLDLMPMCDNLLQQDFLSWQPQKGKYISIGNPPFGYRAWLALAFLQHASLFSDYIGMILPMAFQSDGKGSPKNRVNLMELVHSEILPKGSFVKPDGSTANVNALWQIWKKTDNKKIVAKKTCRNWLDIFTVDFRKERLCGMNKMANANAFLQRTYFGCRPPKLVSSFDYVRYTCGYGLIFKKNAAELKLLLDTTDWNIYSNLAAHNCRHISMYHIEQRLIDEGFSDDRL
ncbi:MAG: hypothetical protein LBB08_00720 [Rickettsiales bacterium]|jgi:hypothetical protein|nr:hypothetical protein [Rickettsiales bacterium]